MNTSIFSLIQLEEERQENTINLIASENYTSKNIMEATGSVLTNKYAEGYPTRRYYGGCQVIDQVESYALELGKKLFSTDHINVQPHSGSSANFAAYFSLLKPGDTILGMSLAAGGHLTHGYPANFSGNLFKAIGYGVNQETEQLDYQEIARLTYEHRPKMIIAGASAYSRLIDYQKMAALAQEVNAILLVDMAHIAGLVAAQVIPSPIPHADIVTSTTHKTLRGPRGGFICCKEQHKKSIDKAIIPGTQGGPLMHVIAAKALAFEQALTQEFKKYQQQVIKNAHVMATTFQTAGYRIVSGGTDTHLFLVDLRTKNNHPQQLTGKQAEEILNSCNIIVNRNSIPFDPQPPTITSGIRIGSPAITTRGLNENDAIKIVALIIDALTHHEQESFIQKIKQEIAALCKQHPIYN